MNQARLRVSFVVVTHNRRDELAECLRSCRRQTCPDKEILVVDNASTDDTLEMLARDFPDVRVVPLKENRGVSGGRNAGVEAALGDVCIHVDDDAVFVGDQVGERAAAYFEADDRLACVGFTIRDAASGVEERKSIPRRDKRSLLHDYEAAYFCGAGFAVRRRPFLDLGMFWPPLVYGSQELDLSYRWLDAGWRILHSAEIEILHKSTPTARPAGQWVFFNARDRVWVAVRNLPWRCVASTAALWWAHTFLVAVRRGEIGSFASGVGRCLEGIMSAWRFRKVVSSSTAARLRELSGRFWY